MTPPRPRSAAATSAAILDAARARFGTDGFERTTIRAVAADAAVDPALVMRYFGSKESLFTRAAAFALDLPDLRGLDPELAPVTLLARFFTVWENDRAFLSLFRAACTSEAASTAMQRVLSEQIAPALEPVVPDHVEQRSALVSSQLLGLAMTRYVLRVPAVVALTHDELTAWIAPVLRYYFTEPL